MWEVEIMLIAYCRPGDEIDPLLDYIASLAGALIITTNGNEIHIDSPNNTVAVSIAQKLLALGVPLEADFIYV